MDTIDLEIEIKMLKSAVSRTAEILSDLHERIQSLEHATDELEKELRNG